MVVVDASTVLGWSIPGEQDIFALKALRFVEKSGAVAPVLLRYEVTNVLRTLNRREHITTVSCTTIAAAIEALPIRLLSPDTPSWFHAAFALAQQFELTAYDASYLHLATSMTLKLITLDKKLAAAAKDAKCLWTGN